MAGARPPRNGGHRRVERHSDHHRDHHRDRHTPPLPPSLNRTHQVVVVLTP